MYAFAFAVSSFWQSLLKLGHGGAEIMELFGHVMVANCACAFGIMVGFFSTGTSGAIDLMNLQGAVMIMMDPKDPKLPWKTKFLRQIMFVDFWALSCIDNDMIWRYPRWIKCWHGSHV